MNQSQSIVNRVTHLLLHNFGLKILSVGFALALFIIVRNQQVREFNRTVKVQIKTHRGIIVTGAPERVVNVTLKMPDTLFSRVPTDDELTGEVDLRDERLGKIRVGLSSDNFPNLDKRYSLTMHEPWLDIELDRLEKKRLPVRAVLQGTPKSGFEISKVVVTPPEIELTGPKQALSKLDSISTIPVDITNLGRRDYNAQAGLAIELRGSLKPSIDIVTVKVIFAESPPQQLK